MFSQLDPTGTWTVDVEHSEIGFAVRHMGVGKTRGRFTNFSGTVIADPKKLGTSSVRFTVEAQSIDTANPKRDAHLRSGDFFDVEKFPTLSFESTKIEKAGKGYQATGRLTIRGVTKVVSFPFTVSNPVKDLQGKSRAGVEAKLSINRSDYGLLWNALVEGTQVVGEQVEISLDLEGIKR